MKTIDSTTTNAAPAAQAAQDAPGKAASRKHASRKKGAPKGHKAARKPATRKAAKPTTKPTTKVSTKKAASKEAAVPRAASKKAKVLDLLRRETGATNEEIRTSTGWQPHTVRGFLSIAGKKLKIETIKRENGDRAYYIGL